MWDITGRQTNSPEAQVLFYSAQMEGKITSLEFTILVYEDVLEDHVAGKILTIRGEKHYCIYLLSWWLEILSIWNIGLSTNTSI